MLFRADDLTHSEVCAEVIRNAAKRVRHVLLKAKAMTKGAGGDWLVGGEGKILRESAGGRAKGGLCALLLSTYTSFPRSS